MLEIHEASIAAETRVEWLLMRVLDKLHALNSRLHKLHNEIKVAQPVSSGSVCLELYTCGPCCAGCPHARWLQYSWTKGTAERAGRLIGVNLNAKKRDPVLALARKTEHYAATVALIREAKRLLIERAALLKWLKQAHYVAA